jgi:ribose transport system permease protein
MTVTMSPVMGLSHPFRTRVYLFSLIFAVVLLVANIIALPRFGSPSLWAENLTGFAPFAIAAMASTPSVLSGGGGIDISIGPLVTLVNVVLVAILLPHGLGAPYVAVPILLVLGAGIGAINGVFIAVLRYQPVVTTLCVNFVLSGLCVRLLARPKSAGSNWTGHLAESFGPVPGALLTIGAPVLIWLALRRTAYIRTLYAVGGDDVTAFSAGVNVAAIRIIAYVIGGLFAAIGGIALTALLQSADASDSTQYTLVALAAVALGGTSLGGGRGGLACSVLGAACIFLIQNLLDSLHVSTLWLQVVYGGLLLFAVVLGSRLAAGGEPGRR